MFPGAHASVYRNEAGEPTGWDNDAYFEPEYDDHPDDDYDDQEPDENDGMHDYEPTDPDHPDHDSPCLACGVKPGASELHW